MLFSLRQKSLLSTILDFAVEKRLPYFASFEKFLLMASLGKLLKYNYKIIMNLFRMHAYSINNSINFIIIFNIKNCVHYTDNFKFIKLYYF